MNNLDHINAFIAKYQDDKKKGLSFAKLNGGVNINELKDILLLIRRKNVFDNTEVLIKVIEITEYVTSNLFSERDYGNVLNILDSTDVILIELIQKENLGFNTYLNLKIKHIKALVLNGLIYDAIYRTYDVLNSFKANKKLVTQPDYRDILKRIKSLLSYIRKSCVQTNNLKTSVIFKIKEKNFDRKLICKGIHPTKDQDLLILPQHSRPESSSFYLSIGSDIKYFRGIKKFWFIFHLLISYSVNILSKYFWGYGEKLWPIVSFSIGTIIFYTFLIFFEYIHVLYKDLKYSPDIISSLYFSIVTFTSLGYGDIQPASDSVSRILMSCEALLGLLLISITIFLIGKKSVQ